MTWNIFLEAQCREKKLTPKQIEVVMCLKESECPSRQELLQTYNKLYSPVEQDAFVQRLRQIYKKFNILDSPKLQKLHQDFTKKYIQYLNKDVFFSEIGLTYIHPSFPRDIFGKEIDNLINLDDQENKKVDIMQTFAPNLNDYFEHFIQCIKNDVQLRILLAWPYSEAAKLREAVLRRYVNRSISDEIDIRDRVIANLEMLEKILRITNSPKLLNIKLYDTLPSLAIYRAGNYMLAASFLHGSLAVNTFQLELKVNAPNQLIVNTLQNNFELMWQVAREFYPDPQRNWRNDLKILFTS